MEVFGTTELAHILSFTLDADTFNVMLTCKQWYLATRMRHFWYKRIDRAKDVIISANKSFALSVRAFDTFNSPIAETLRQQVEWTRFPLKWTAIDTTKFHSEITRYPTVSRRTHTNTCVEQIFGKDGVMDYRLWYETDEKFRGVGKLVREATRAWDPAIRLEYEDYSNLNKSVSIILKTQHGVFDGRAKKIGVLLQPHGAGKWTFDDGEILEGSDVAYEGEPKKKLKT